MMRVIVALVCSLAFLVSSQPTTLTGTEFLIIGIDQQRDWIFASAGEPGNRTLYYDPILNLTAGSIVTIKIDFSSADPVLYPFGVTRLGGAASGVQSSSLGLIGSSLSGCADPRTQNGAGNLADDSYVVKGNRTYYTPCVLTFTVPTTKPDVNSKLYYADPLHSQLRQEIVVTGATVATTPPSSTPSTNPTSNPSTSSGITPTPTPAPTAPGSSASAVIVCVMSTLVALISALIMTA